MLACAADVQRPFGSRHAAPRRHLNAQLTAQVAGRERIGVAQDRIEPAHCDDLSSVASRPRTQVDDFVGGADRLFIVLHDQDRVAEIAQLAERVQQTGVVALVQPDRGFVEDVEHPDETAADLGGQADPLRFATGQRHGRALEGEVVEPDVLQEPQAVDDLLQDRAGDLGVESPLPVATQGQGPKELERIHHGQVHDLADALPVHQHGETLWLEPTAPARRAALLDHEFLELLAHAVGRRLAIALLDVFQDAGPARLVRPLPALAMVLIGERLARRTEQDRLAGGRREVLPRRVEIELERAGEGGQHDLAQIA